MGNKINLFLVVEDVLGEEVIRKVINDYRQDIQIGVCYGKSGLGYIKKHISAFNNASKGQPYMVFADLDQDECAPSRIKEMLPVPKSSNLIFRIAVREVESWILADREAFAGFAGIRQSLIPYHPDNEADPKLKLIKLVTKSSKRLLKEAVVPAPGSTAKIGPAYNAELVSFVRNQWNPEIAAENSDSLSRAIKAIKRFQPIL